MPLNIEREREEFEAHWLQSGWAYPNLARSKEHGKTYEFANTEIGWKTWLACAEAKDAEIQRLREALEAAINVGGIELPDEHDMAPSDFRQKPATSMSHPVKAYAYAQGDSCWLDSEALSAYLKEKAGGDQREAG